MKLVCGISYFYFQTLMLLNEQPILLLDSGGKWKNSVSYIIIILLYYWIIFKII